MEPSYRAAFGILGVGTTEVGMYSWYQEQLNSHP